MALTRDKIFWDAFAGHAALTVQAAGLLRELLEKPAEAERLAREISVIEGQGDKITHDTVHALHQTWITPLDREEIHALISKLDDVLDFVEAASERIVLYEIAVATPDALDLARVLCNTAEAVAQAVTALKSMHDPKAILALCVAINDHESEADHILRKALAKLFKKGPGDAKPDPLEVIKWRDIYEMLETATDRAEDVANIIEGIVLEHG